MSRAKSERILNLTLYLLSARRYLSRDQIRAAVEGYAGLRDEAFERAFERDKDELRQLGVPIETGSNSPLFDDEIGYRIRRDEFELPPIEFTSAEARVLGIAAHVWQQTAMAESTVAAMGKLRAAGVQVDSDRIAALAPAVTAREAAFPAIWQATARHHRVRFDYREPGRGRVVDPWRILHRHGSWYFLARDVDKDEPRMFKLSRIVGAVTELHDTYEVPADIDLDELTRSLEPAAPDTEALLAIRPDRAPALRRRGTPAPAIPGPAGFVVHRVPYSEQEGFVGLVAAAGADVVVLEPDKLRQAVIAHLQSIAGEGR